MRQVAPWQARMALEPHDKSFGEAGEIEAHNQDGQTSQPYYGFTQCQPRRPGPRKSRVRNIRKRNAYETLPNRRYDVSR